MTRTTIDLATLADIEALCELLLDLFTQEADFEPNYEKQTSALTDIIEHPDTGHILLCKHDAKPIGMVNIIYMPSTVMGGRVAFLEDMIIAEPYRNQGFGSTLLSAAIEFIKRQNCQRITLLTDRQNKSAQAFYERHGFTHSAMTPMRYYIAD